MYMYTVETVLTTDDDDIMCSGARFLSRTDTVTVSVWNNRKVHKKEGAGFLGCVRLTPPTITRLKDTGCESYPVCVSTPTTTVTSSQIRDRC